VSTQVTVTLRSGTTSPLTFAQVDGNFSSLASAINANGAQLDNLSNGAGATFSAAMVTWFNSLPTTLPATPGVLWNNMGTLSQS